MSAVTGYRISPQQAACWRANQDNQQRPVTVCLQLELTSVPTAEILQRRLQALADREEILRTRLHALDGMALPIQIIDGKTEIPLAVEDWRTLAATAQADKLQTLAADSLPDQALQVWLIRLSDNNWALVLAAISSHLDGYSLSLIARELLGTPPGETGVQYADYAEWKHSLLEAEPDHPGLHFWREQAEETAAPTGDSAPLDTVAAHISLTDLQGRAEALNINTEDYLFACWCILLSRLTGQSQVSLTRLSDGRGEGLENALGLYEQALPVQVDVDLGQALSAQIETLLQPYRLAVGWQDYFDSRLTCDLSFAYHHLPRISDKHHLSAFKASCQQAALGLECQVVGAELSCHFVSDRALGSKGTATYLKEQWQGLLQGLADHPSTPAGAIPLLGPQQKRLLETKTPEPAIEPVSILALIERQVDAHPLATALSDSSGTLNYRGMAVRSNRLARHLRARGIQPGEVVGILLNRSNDMIIALLAVMKAGGVYLPLDPSYPEQRLAAMVDDSGTHLIISTAQYTALLPRDRQHLLLDEIAPPLEALSAAPLTLSTDLQDLAYLIYTSGSTGSPKAVEISHANLSHSTQVRMAFYVEPVRAYLLLSSLAFDSSVAGIFWTLAQGGNLVLPNSGEELDLARLCDLIAMHQVSHSLSLPSLYKNLLDYAEGDSLSSLSTWIVAGETCTPQALAKHRRQLSQARLVNEYGPTEATVWASAAVLTDHPGEDISIGRPIPTVGLWLLNEHQVPAAVGEPGEIHLGGPTLAGGYRGKAEQTDRAFVFHPTIGERVYKTGDLARWRADGCLDFIGRVDKQIKVRGYRVELGEIERQLCGHSDVDDAVVLVRQGAGSVRLVAYVLNHGAYKPDPQALAAYLGERLPVYMVPAHFICLAAFPRTANGKIDSNALPNPDLNTADLSPYLAPRNDLEAELAAICAEVLERDKVGVLDNFFQIGGDSILSLQIVSRANQRGIHLTAKQIFDCETVAHMAEVASREDREQTPEIPSPQTCLTPSEEASAEDFPLAQLDQDAFNNVLTELEAEH